VLVRLTPSAASLATLLDLVSVVLRD